MEQAFNKPYPNMECNCTTVKEIEQIIKSLKSKTSQGYDEISTKILKISCPFISSPINFICNKMLFGGIFPNRLKYANIIPLHKNGDKCEAGESNGKLPLRTCPGCSVPEPYQSPDWVLVSAQTGPKAEYQ